MSWMLFLAIVLGPGHVAIEAPATFATLEECRDAARAAVVANLLPAAATCERGKKA